MAHPDEKGRVYGASKKTTQKSKLMERIKLQWIKMWAVKCFGCKDMLAPHAKSIVDHDRSTWNRDGINLIACSLLIFAAQGTASRARIEAHLGHNFRSAPGSSGRHQDGKDLFCDQQVVN